MIPVFTRNRLTSLASSSAPAASPQLRRRPSSWPPHQHAKPATESTIPTGGSCTATRPLSTRFEPVPRLRSFTTGSSRTPSDLAHRTQPVWQYQALPTLSALLPTLPSVSRTRLRSASTRLLRQPSEKASHLLQLRAPHGAQAPHGAPRPRAARENFLFSGRAPHGAQAPHGAPRPRAARENFLFSGQVRPSAAAATRRAGPVLAALRAAGPAAAHDKGPITKNGSSQATGPCAF
jgi:hypothetical protein